MKRSSLLCQLPPIRVLGVSLLAFTILLAACNGGRDKLIADLQSSRPEERANAVKKLRAADVRVSIFIDPDPAQVAESRAVGAEAIEINTGGYSDASGADRPARLEEVRQAAAAADARGLEVLAGHGLTYVNVRPIVAIGEIVELNIGHSIIARAALVGLERAVREMVALLEPR